jgi:predicted ATPase
MVPRIRQLQIRHFKSIGQAVVDLGALTALVGPNAAGKSNLLDALAFVQECLSSGIELAFKNRGGIAAVRRRSGGHPYHIGLRLLLDLRELQADYAFEIAAKPGERFRVSRERCVVQPFFGERVQFEVKDGEFIEPIPGIRPQVVSDRLVLFAASATSEFRPVFDFLTAIRTYSIVPDVLRALQDPDEGEYLSKDGSNAAAVLRRLKAQPDMDDRYARICRLLAQVAHGVEDVEDRSVGQKETLQFRQDVGLKDPWTFDALNMSDGTLRVLGLLLAIYQPNLPSVIGIEEPESTVHPGVAELVVQTMLDASRRSQIVITTHSPDILDSKDLHDDQIRVVTKEAGSTVLAPLSPVNRALIRERLSTPGELLRSGELAADPEEVERSRTQQLDLFRRTMPAEFVTNLS